MLDGRVQSRDFSETAEESHLQKELRADRENQMRELRMQPQTSDSAVQIGGRRQAFVAERKGEELETIIKEEKLKPDETRKFIEASMQAGEIRTVGTDIDKLMPPVSRFGGGNRAAKKQNIIERLKTFFEKFFGIG